MYLLIVEFQWETEEDEWEELGMKTTKILYWVQCEDLWNQ